MKTNYRTLIIGLVIALSAIPLIISAENETTGLKFKNFASKIDRTVSCAEGNAEYKLEYSVDWPVSGYPDAVTFARNWVITRLVGENNVDFASLSSPEPILNSIAESDIKDLKDEISEAYSPIFSYLFKSLIVEAEVDSANCTLISRNTTQGGQRIIEDADNITFKIEGGKSFSLDMVKNITNLSDLLWLSELANSGEYIHEVFVNSVGDVYSDIKDIPTPVFTKEGVTFLFPLSVGGVGITQYKITVPYDEIVPLMTDEAISFIPEEYLNNYYKNDEQLTEDIVTRLWWFGLPDHGRLNKYTGQALSREFEKAVERDWRLDEESEEEVGYETAYYWYTGQETNENGMKIKAVNIITLENDKAMAIVEFELFDNYVLPYTLSLIKEPRKLRNGKIAKKWVIDDFIKEDFSKLWSKKEGKYLD